MMQSLVTVEHFLSKKDQRDVLAQLKDVTAPAPGGASKSDPVLNANRKRIKVPKALAEALKAISQGKQVASPDLADDNDGIYEVLASKARGNVDKHVDRHMLLPEQPKGQGLTVVVYLTAGGTLVFPGLDKSIDISPGLLVAFPSDEPHKFVARGNEARAMIGPVALRGGALHGCWGWPCQKKEEAEWHLRDKARKLEQARKEAAWHLEKVKRDARWQAERIAKEAKQLAERKASEARWHAEQAKRRVERAAEAAKKALEQLVPGGGLGMRNNTGRTVWVYGMTGLEWTARNGATNRWPGCPSGAWLLLRDDGELACLISPALVNGKHHDLKYWFEMYSLSEVGRKVKDIINFNWRDLVQKMVDSIKKSLPSVKDIFPDFGGEKIPKIPGYNPKEKLHGTKVFKQHFRIMDGQVEVTPALGVHLAVSDLRQEVEDVRDCLRQSLVSMRDAAETTNGANELQAESRQVKLLLDILTKAAQAAGKSGNPVIVLVANVIKKAMRVLSSTLKKTGERMKKLHESYHLERKTRKILAHRAKVNSPGVFNTLEKVNDKLMKLEKKSAQVALKWPSLRKKDPTGTSKKAEALMTDAKTEMQKAINLLKPVAVRAKQAQGVMAVTTRIMKVKRSAVAIVHPIKSFAKLFNKVLSAIQAALTKFFKLPVIAQLSAFMDKITTMLWDVLAKCTGLNSVFEKIENMNPFRDAMSEDGVKRITAMDFEIPNLEAILNNVNNSVDKTKIFELSSADAAAAEAELVKEGERVAVIEKAARASKARRASFQPRNVGGPPAIGSFVRIKHQLTNKYLHSHGLNYSGGSKQQQVTCNGNKDSNNLWKVFSYKPLRLEHKNSGVFLHSHSCLSPATRQHEVSGHGGAHKTDSNSDWQIEGDFSLGGMFKLIHQNTNYALHSHRRNFPLGNGDTQQEVTCFGGRDNNDNWTITEVDAAAETWFCISAKNCWRHSSKRIAENKWSKLKGDWSGSRGLCYHKPSRALFVIQDGNLLKIPTTGPDANTWQKMPNSSWKKDGSLGCWGLAATADALFACDDGKLWKIDPYSGKCTKLPGGWKDVQGMCHHHGFLWIAESNRLWKVDAKNGKHSQLPGTWKAGAQNQISLTGCGESIYVVEGDDLWCVNIHDGKYDKLKPPNTNWKKTHCIATGPDGKLYAAQNKKTYQIEPSDGKWKEIHGSWTDTVHSWLVYAGEM